MTADKAPAAQRESVARAALDWLGLLIGSTSAITMPGVQAPAIRVPVSTSWVEPDTLPAMAFDDGGNVGSEGEPWPAHAYAPPRARTHSPNKQLKPAAP